MNSFLGKPGMKQHVNFRALLFLFMCACLCLQKRVNSSLSQNVNNCRLMFHPLPLLTTSVLVEQLLNVCRIHEEKAVISKQVY